MKKKRGIYFVIVLLIINIYLLLYLVNFNLIAFDRDFYKEEFEKHGIYDELNEYDIEEVNDGLLNYLKKGEGLIDDGFFNQKEKDHLLDVREVFQKLFVFFNYVLIAFILLIVILFFLVKKEGNRKLLKYSSIVLVISGGLTFLDTLFFSYLLNVKFDYLFTKFHEIFFKDGSWTFDALTDKIVVLYPEGFFIDIAFKIVVNVLISSLVLVILGVIGLWVVRKKGKKR